MTTILALPGSLRRESYNRKLLRAAVELRPPSVNVLLYDDLGAVPLFDEDLEEQAQGNPPGVGALRSAVAAADGLLIATPEYNWAPPGVLKNALDWLSRPAPLDGGSESKPVLVGKPVAVLGASSGRWGTRLAQAGLRQVLAATESRVMPAPAVFVAEAARAFDAQGRLSDPRIGKQLAELLEAFTRWIEDARPAAQNKMP
jgi:chromate reductase, NAD(P)H dehydrogenase (quinone)